MLITLFASYLHWTNLDTDSPTPEEKEDHNTEPFFDNSYKHLLFHDNLQEIVQIELSPHFIQQCDKFYKYDILHSIIKYVRNFPTQLSVNLVQDIFYLWPQYIDLVDHFIEWADQTENFTEAELYYTQTYDSLADSLEDQIYIIAHNIHKCIQIVASKYYKRHRLILDALTTISYILREIIYFLQITPEIGYANYQDCTIIEEIQYLFQDDKDLETIQLGLLELPFVDIDDIELHYTLFHTEEFHKFRIYRPTKESIIIGVAQGNLQAAQINFSPYIGYNRQIQQPLPQHRPQQQQQQPATTTGT